MMERIRKLDPAVDKRYLIAISGIIWTTVGLLLCNVALRWLVHIPGVTPLWFAMTGLVLALLIHHFGFLRLVDRNIERIRTKEGKVCVFAFQPWKSYIIIAVMIMMGTALRNSSLPRSYLSIIYVGFGGAMILSSLRYYRVFIDLTAGSPKD